MERKKLKQQARELLKGNLGALLLILLTVFASFSALSFLGIAGSLITLIIEGPVMLSLAVIFLKFVKTKNSPDLKELGYGFQSERVFVAFLAYIRICVFTFLWSLLLIVPGIIKAIAYSQTFFLMADDPQLSAKAAQAKSMQIMDGHKRDLFVLYLSFIPWVLLVIVTFGLALVYVAPYLQTTYTLFYRSLVPAPALAKKAKKSEK